VRTSFSGANPIDGVAWHAPIGRNAKEAAWIKAVAGFMPEAVPGLLGEDRAAGMFAMRYLPTETYPNWKAQLARGEVAPAAAAAVGARLARIHAELARRPESREEFATDDTFRAIRLEPYLLATARAHPDISGVLSRKNGCRLLLRSDPL
jgi:hypothetical protein